MNWIWLMQASLVLETSAEDRVTVELRLALWAAITLSQSLWLFQSWCPFFPLLVGPWHPWTFAIYRTLPGDRRSRDITFQQDPSSTACCWWDAQEKAHEQWVVHSWRETPGRKEENKECICVGGLLTEALQWELMNTYSPSPFLFQWIFKFSLCSLHPWVEIATPPQHSTLNSS